MRTRGTGPSGHRLPFSVDALWGGGAALLVDAGKVGGRGMEVSEEIGISSWCEG